MTTAPKLISGLSELAPDYDALICDVWGVVHDGVAAHAEACDALVRFRREHGPVLLLSNAPRPAHEVKEQLDRFGVPRDAYDDVMTSGAASRMALETRIAMLTRTLRLHHLGPERDVGVYDGLDVELVPADAADVVLCTGLFDDYTDKPGDYADIYAAMKARGLTMICANPDIVVGRGGVLLWCAGAVAAEYEKIGGTVEYYGKPHRPVYDLAMAMLGNPSRVLAIGDGIVTDIRGAQRAGLDALFIADGIHGEDVKPYTPGHMAELFDSYGVSALAASRALVW